MNCTTTDLLFQVKNFILICFLLQILDKALGTLLNMLLHLWLQVKTSHWSIQRNYHNITIT